MVSIPAQFHGEALYCFNSRCKAEGKGAAEESQGAKGKNLFMTLLQVPA